MGLVSLGTGRDLHGFAGVGRRGGTPPSLRARGRRARRSRGAAGQCGSPASCRQGRRCDVVKVVVGPRVRISRQSSALRSGELDLAAEVVRVGGRRARPPAIDFNRNMLVPATSVGIVTGNRRSSPYISVPATWVATSTGTRVPASGWLVTTRSDRVRVATPLTLATGPRRLTRSITRRVPCQASGGPAR